MTIDNESDTVSYTGSGTTGPFPFTYKVFAASHLTVIKRLLTSPFTDETLVLDTDYTVTIDGPDSGYVTTTDAVSSGYKLFIIRNVPYTQESNFRTQGQQNAASWENAFDFDRMVDLRLKRNTAASIKLPESEDPADFTTELPVEALRANKALWFDASGNVTVTEGTVTEIPDSSLTQVVTSIAALRALAVPSGAVTYLVKGYYTAADGGGGVFVWDSASSTADNDGTVIELDAGGTGRFKRLYSGALNVKWFGAKGDGSTDDTNAIQAAVDTGLDVFIPATEDYYEISANILVAASGQTIFGSGKLSYIYQTHATNAAIKAVSKARVTVRDLRITPPGAQASNKDGSACTFDTCTFSVMRNIHVSYNGTTQNNGLILADSDDCAILDCETEGANMPDGSLSSAGGIDIGILYSGSRNVIRGNQVKSTNLIGIAQETQNINMTQQYNVIADNVVSNSTMHGIIVYDVLTGGTVTDTTIVGNTVQNIKGSIATGGGDKSYGNGIYVQGAHRITITGNVVRNTNIQTDDQTIVLGAIAVNTDDVTITGNTIDTSEVFGIWVNSVQPPLTTGNGCVIANNIIKNCGDGFLDGAAGIALYQVPRSIIRDNFIGACEGGILKVGNALSFDTICIIEGNIIESPSSGKSGISAGEVTTLICRGNWVNNSTSSPGIYSENVTRLILENNVVLATGNAAAAGIDTPTAATYMLIKGNVSNGTGGSGGATNYGIRMNSPGIITWDNDWTGNGTGATTGTYTPVKAFNASATPTIRYGEYWRTNGTTGITDFVGASVGQSFTIECVGAGVTITHNGNIKLNGAANFVMVVGDTLTLVYNGTNFVETSRKV